jgi:hypothetical protein
MRALQYKPLDSVFAALSSWSIVLPTLPAAKRIITTVYYLPIHYPLYKTLKLLH